MYSSSNNMQQGGHPHQQNWQGGIQQQQQQQLAPPPMQQAYPQHHQQGVQYQFEMDMVVANQQRGQPQQQIMHVPNTLLGVHQAQHQQHNQQQQQQEQIMSAQQQQQQMVSSHQYYSMIYNALETDGLKRIYRREIRSFIFFTCLEASGEWKRIRYRYGIVLIRDGVDANSCNLKEGTHIVQPKYVCGNDILPECYDESYTKYVSNSELGKQYLRLFSSILGTDELQQQKQKRQRLEHQPQREEESLSTAREQLINKQQSYQKQVKLQLELDQQKEHYDAPDSEIFADILTEMSKETGDSNKVYDKASDDIISQMMGMKIDETISQQEDFTIKALSISLFKMLERKRNRISKDIETGKENVKDALAAKDKAKEVCARLSAKAKEERNRVEQTRLAQGKS